MDEQFDNKLTDRIREVFDTYEYPPAEHGWEELRKKFPAQEKRNKVAWLWWSSAAAVILLALGIGVWYNSASNSQNNLAAVKPAVKQRVKDSVIAPTQATDQQQTTTIAKAVPADKPSYVSPYVQGIGAAPQVPYRVAATSMKVPAAQHAVETTQPENAALIAQAKNTTAATTTIAVDSAKAVIPSSQQPQLAQATQPAENNAVVQPQQNVMANNTAPKRQQSAIMDMFEQEKRNQNTAQKNVSNKQIDKKVTFAVYAATYFNYSEGSTNQVNAGAGVSSDFRLSKKLKLSTGVALAQNTLNYNSASTAPQSRSAAALVASAPLRDNMFALSAAVPVFRNYNVNMVGIDIPVNLKYEFNPDKTDAFISAGLSSGTFLDENYTYKYTYSNGTVADSKAVGEDHNESSHNSFSNFYFGKMLNVSFGIGYPVGNNRLIVEPFVKYPLGGLGAQDIRFGSGGLNLKFSFKGGKR